MNYWLMKSEPATFGIEHLQAAPDATHCWDGVRNYQARNFLRDAMQIGDLAFFYHSNCKTPGIVGIMKIASQSYPDSTAFDANSKYFDAKSSPENPRWYMRDVQLLQKLNHIVTLDALRGNQHLSNMMILRKGNRLSITPILLSEWTEIIRLSKRHNV